jgi:uncharacterized membrane protein
MVICATTLVALPVLVSAFGALISAFIGAFFGIFSVWQILLGLPNMFVGICGKFSDWIVPWLSVINVTFCGGSPLI